MENDNQIDNSVRLVLEQANLLLADGMCKGQVICQLIEAAVNFTLRAKTIEIALDIFQNHPPTEDSKNLELLLEQAKVIVKTMRGE